MEKYLKDLPVETYVLLLPSFFIGLLLILLQAPFSVFLSTILPQGIVGYILGNQMFVAIAVSTAAYAIAKVIVTRLKNMYFSKETSIHHIRSFLFIAATILITSAFQSGMVYQLFINADISKITSVSSALMDIDHKVTGTYPSFAFSISPFFERILLNSFSAVSFLVPLLLAILFFWNKNLFRRFLLNFFLIIFISIPLWTFFPALSPQLMYRDNLLSIEIPERAASKIGNRRVSPVLGEFLLRQKFLAIDPTLQSLPVATFPSLQGTLSVLVAFYAYALSPFLGIIAVVWLILSFIGGMYTEQHYLMDSIAALALGGISITFVKIILGAEKKYYTDHYSLFYLPEKAADDTKKFFGLFYKKEPKK